MQINQAWMEGVLQELKWRDEKIMKLENELHKAALLIEEGCSGSKELKRRINHLHTLILPCHQERSLSQIKDLGVR